MSSIEIFNLTNYGYLRDTLPPELLESIKEECSQLEERNAKYVSGILAKYHKPSQHYMLGEENKKSLLNFVTKFINEYDKVFGYTRCWQLLNKNLPFAFSDPWINVQENFQNLPVHTHAGVFSYTGWINLPPESLFEFLYPSTIGLSLTQRIELTPEDEGGIIIFPSMLQHCVHPFSDNSKRISVSGNIVLEVS